jgi:hypothetical protein
MQYHQKAITTTKNRKKANRMEENTSHDTKQLPREILSKSESTNEKTSTKNKIKTKTIPGNLYILQSKN